jgi:hypothetical protein
MVGRGGTAKKGKQGKKMQRREVYREPQPDPVEEVIDESDFEQEIFDQDDDPDGAEEALQAEVAAIRANTVSPKSRDTYRRSSSRFLLWCYEKKRTLLTQQFINTFEEHIPPRKRVIAIASTQKWIKIYLEGSTSETPPIKFQALKAEDFMMWIVTLKKRDGSKPGNSAYSTHRAALFNLFRDHKVRMSQDLETELANHYRGLKRTTASSAANGNGVVKTGKSALEFSLYRSFGLQMMKSSTARQHEYIFSHLFMLLCWNLMCRSINVVKVCLNHIEWIEDSLCIYFAHQKCDQAGERPKDPRHIYANPIMPEICPVLSLGIYLLCFPPANADQKPLFPGSSQYDHYRKVFTKFLDIPKVTEELVSRGLQKEDLGTHSKRKGSSTYASSGSTSCPSSVAIHIRAGWSLGPVQDRYLRYEAAGDMHVGRTVCGLPQNSAEFSILPPHFVGIEPQRLAEIKKLLFPTMPHHMNRVLEFVLASVVYHEGFLRRTLPQDHLLFSTPLFTQNRILQELKQSVCCKIAEPSDLIQPTGVPPHVMLLTQMQQMAQSVNVIVPQVIEGVIDVLEERAIGARTVTRDGLEQMIKNCLEQAGVAQLVQRLSEPSQHQVVESSSPQSREQGRLYTWGVHFMFFPKILSSR